MEKETVYTACGETFSTPEKAIKYEADHYGALLIKKGWTAPAAARQVNAVESFLTYQETGQVPEATAKKAEKK